MNKRYYSRSFKILLLGIDLTLITVIYILVYVYRFSSGIHLTESYFSLLILFILIWIIVSLYYKNYSIKRLSNIRVSTPNLIYTFLLHILFISASFVSFKANEVSWLFLAIVYSVSLISLLLTRLSYYSFIKNHRKNDYNVKKVIIVGTEGLAQQLYDYFNSDQSTKHELKGLFEDNPDGNYPQKLILGGINDISSYCLKEQVNEIYYTKSLGNTSLIKELTDFTEKNNIHFRIVPDFTGLKKSKVDISFLNDVPIINYTKAPLGSFFNRLIKRIFDVVFSLMVICLIFPFVFPVIVILIRLDSNGPIFFKQFRPGKGNKLFECYKFRTMSVNTNTELQATKGDARITKVGAVLRKTSLDELPQFFNVLRGDMSVVGPRPNLISQLEYYSKEIKKYNFRHFITPGITGYAQVNGYRGETRDIYLMKKRVELDAWYIENWRLTLDLKIIIYTVWNMIKGEKNAF